MAGIERFEDVESWKAGVELVNEIYRITAYGAFSQDYTLRNQIRKAAVSIPSNIAEGFERNRRGEFAQFLRYAKGSAGEVRSQLYHARDQKYVSEETFKTLHTEVSRISRHLQGFINHLEETSF
jgi:four helix bundle protein